MSVLAGYEPQEVLKYFEEICSIPHGSGNIGQISDYLVSFAKSHNLSYRQDAVGNVIIRKKATPGYEKEKGIILQGHMDMVAVKTEDCTKDLSKEGLDLEVIDGDILTAKDTTLGGDDGIAIAYSLALLHSEDIPHPALEAIFTIDEEIGLLGATDLDCADVEGRIMINIDSEDEGIFTVSCAGGVTGVAHLPVSFEEAEGELLSVKISGFKGGHSGVEINTGRLNSNLTLGRMLNALKDTALRIVSVSGGEKDNAIAKVSSVELLCPAGTAEETAKKLQDKMDEIAAEYSTVERGLKIVCESAGAVSKCMAMTKESTKRIISALLNVPNGIQRMNPDMPDMVQTSLNLGIVQMRENEVEFSAAIRSSSASEKTALMERFTDFFEMLGGSEEMFGDYPGWEYNPNSIIRDRFVKAYKEQTGKEPLVVGIHAGLECGIFAKKLLGMDAISVGPDMRDVHTTEETLNLSSVARTWELLKMVLAQKEE